MTGGRGPPTFLRPTPRPGSIGSTRWSGTGYRTHDHFIDPALVEPHGRLRHHEGVTEVPGLYVLCLPVTRRRSSGLLAGIGADASEFTDHFAAHVADKRNAA